MFVSVIVPSYGRPEGLLRLVGLLLVQDAADTPYEVVVVDDGSPEPVGPHLGAHFPAPRVPLRCVRKPNGGPASARNFGAAQARGDLLLFVDDDMVVRPDFVREHARVQHEQGPALVNSHFVWDLAATRGPFAGWYAARVEVWNTARRDHRRPVADGVFAIPHVHATTASLSVPRAVFDELGGFDTGYPFGCEDQDFALRTETAGYPALLTTRTVATHVEPHNTLRKVCRRQERGSADTVRFIRRFAVDARFGRPAIARVNDPARLGVDPWRVVCKQVVKRVVASRLLAGPTFATAGLLGRLFPRSAAVLRLYDLLVSAYIQRGWREGLRRYAHEEPLPAFAALAGPPEPGRQGGVDGHAAGGHGAEPDREWECRPGDRSGS